MADYMPLILVGGLAVGGFILWQQGVFNNLFTPPAAATPAPVSGSTASTTVSGTSSMTSCMGTDILTGQPCPCPSISNVAYSYPTGFTSEPHGRRQSGPRRVVVFPGQPEIFPGSFGSQIPGSISTTCDCSRCGSQSILGGLSPSQFSTSGGDLNNFIGQSIARAGYRIG